MSIVLIVTKDKKQVAKVPVTSGVFVIGRSDKCNLCIDEELASRQHAEIFREGSNYSVRDKGSRNGTLVNGEKITAARELKDGDDIEIGSTRIKFLSEEAGDDDEAHTVAATPQELMAKDAGQVVVEKKEKGNLDVKLRVADGPLAGALFKNWEGVLTIGRSKENNVMLVDDAVSTFHAKITQQGDNYFIEDTNSANGTFLNGVKVLKTQLVAGNKIKVGVSTLIFEVTDLRVQRRNLNIALVSVIVVALGFVAYNFWPDPVGGLILDARKLEYKGDYAHALDEFHKAMLRAPNRKEAADGYNAVKAKMDSASMLQDAQKAAAAENYDKALELVFQAERVYSTQQAKDLEAVIKSIQSAKVALDHQNWEIAVKLLEKSQEAYPSSQLIALQLSQAKKELVALQNLTEAKEAFQYEQWDKARQLLAMVPSASVYANEAKEYSDKIAHQELISGSLGNAKSLYSQGELLQALAEIDRGLKISSDSPPLLDLQTRIRAMVPLAAPLRKADALGQDASIDDMLAGRKACSDVLQTENDPLNSMVKKAKDVDSRLLQWLQSISQTDTDKGQTQLKSGDSTGALTLFTQAVKANPKNTAATAAMAQLQKLIVGQCEELYGTAMRYKELGLMDKVKENLKKVIQLDVPDDKWYKLANDELNNMK